MNDISRSAKTTLLKNVILLLLVNHFEQFFDRQKSRAGQYDTSI